MEGPCSVERRLLTGNLKWLHWLVVIRHLILPVGLLTSFKVPSRIGGISAPPQGTLQQSTRLSRGLGGLGGLGRFPEKACFLVPGRASMDHRQNQNPGMGRGGGAFHSMARRRPTDSRPPLPPVASDQRPPLPTARRPPPTTHSTHRSPGTLHCTTGWYLTQRPPPSPLRPPLDSRIHHHHQKIHSFAAAAAASLTFAFCNHPLRKSSLTPVIRLFLFCLVTVVVCCCVVERIREAEELCQFSIPPIAKPSRTPIAYPDHPPILQAQLRQEPHHTPRSSPHESESVAIHHHPDPLGTCISPVCLVSP